MGCCSGVHVVGVTLGGCSRAGGEGGTHSAVLQQVLQACDRDAAVTGIFLLHVLLHLPQELLSLFHVSKELGGQSGVSRAAQPSPWGGVAAGGGPMGTPAPTWK